MTTGDLYCDICGCSPREYMPVQEFYCAVCGLEYFVCSKCQKKDQKYASNCHLICGKDSCVEIADVMGIIGVCDKELQSD